MAATIRGVKEAAPARRTRLTAAQRRESIMDAAVQVFSAAGYRAGKVSDVAALVGVSLLAAVALLLLIACLNVTNLLLVRGLGKALIKMAKHRWIIERDYEELKQELGLGHFEGRNWRGFHHHATLCIAAYGFLVAERNRFSPSARAGHLRFAALGPAPDFRPRGSPRAPRTT